MSAVLKVIDFILLFYQRVVSPAIHLLVGGPLPGCRFHPSCSQYSREALATQGLIRGTWSTLKRISRCHPWSTAGYDPVPRVIEPKSPL